MKLYRGMDVLRRAILDTGLLYAYSGRSDVQQDKLVVSLFEEVRCAAEGCRAGAVQQLTFERYVNVWAEKTSTVDTTTNSLQGPLASKGREAINISRKCKRCTKETQHIRVFTYDQKRTPSAKYLVVLVHRRDAPLPTATPEEKAQFKLGSSTGLVVKEITTASSELVTAEHPRFRHDDQVYKHDDETLELVHGFP
ncbi:hypothetical protein AAVH_08035 [Aphelenchoides avenae]|nr:hypothetical protein AAVH_08035 [Aphelenchus avenae]